MTASISASNTFPRARATSWSCASAAGAAVGAALLEGAHVGDLPLLLGVGRAHQLELVDLLAVAVLGQEGVDADQRQLAGVLEPLVVAGSPPGSSTRWYIVSIAPSTPPRSEIRSNSS